VSTLNRRSFLKTSLGAAALAGCAAKNGHPFVVKDVPRRGPNDDIRVACIGLRGQGRAHYSDYLGMEHVTLAALCDVDENQFAAPLKLAEEKGKPKPALYTDVRKLLEDKSIDAVSIATPDHWHALPAIWACQNGKDVYVEKPSGHNFLEGVRMVQASRKYNRIMQIGTQSRSHPMAQEAMAFMHAGKLGKIHTARALCFKSRGSIGIKPDSAPPKGVHYDLWLGPAPLRPFNENRFHYNWHWFWDYGTTDMGNQGIHQMDLARWGLRQKYPVKIKGVGGRFFYEDQGETPNTQVTTFEFEDKTQLVFEVRGWYTNDEAGVRIGVLFFGSEGYLAMDSVGRTWKTFLGPKNEPGPSGSGPLVSHFANFIKAVRSRDRNDQNADILEGHHSSALCHLGNVSYRLGREIRFDPKTETCVADREANRMLTREYRKPFVLPDIV
jgi:predicted dehydrogenase